MSARILVVDDVPANVKLLEARLSAEYFDVLTAANGAEALQICARAECDIILLDVMMPDIDGFEVCRRLKSNPATHFIPVVMITALDSPVDRVRGLEAGADDFLTKPVSDIVLIARVRSLTRLKMMTDELRLRAITSLEIGVEAPERSAVADAGKGGRILLVDDRPSSFERLAPVLSSEHSVDVETNTASAALVSTSTLCSLLRTGASRSKDDGRSSTSRMRPPLPASATALRSGASTPISSEVMARRRSSSVIIFRRVSERTRAISTMSDTGLVRKSSAPASRPRTRSTGLSSAVIMTTGMKCVAGFDFSRRQTSKPSISGIITSSRMISHSARAQICSASAPLAAVRTSKYSADSRASNSLTLAGTSSTTR